MTIKEKTNKLKMDISNIHLWCSQTAMGTLRCNNCMYSTFCDSVLL